MTTLIAHGPKITPRASNPPPTAIRPERFRGSTEMQFGKAVALTQFGVNQVTLAPGNWSSLRHWHYPDDEQLGTATLTRDAQGNRIADDAA